MTKFETASLNLAGDLDLDLLDLSKMSTQQLKEIQELLEEVRTRKARNKLAEYKPYPKQLEFHAAGRSYRERLLMAGNQLGKTYSGAAEMAYHLTGLYPDDWPGRRIGKPIRAWAGSKTNEVTRDGVQRLLVGEPRDKEQWGTGLIPHSALLDTSPRQGVPDGLDGCAVRHVPTGGTSTLGFKSYDQGRQKWQGETLDVVWLDEEPDLEIYTEALTRTNATNGFLYMTFTPLLGMSNTVMRFLMEHSPDRHVTSMTIEDALHYTAKQRRQIIASYPEWERDARAKGIPALGSGRVFPVADDEIAIPAFRIPPHFARLIGIDFGWEHPFGAVCIAYDRDSDVIYVTNAYRQAMATPVIHAAAVKPWGDWIPVVWPHDGYAHDKGSGNQLRRLYEEQGLNMHEEHSQWNDGGFGVEAGIMEMLDRMRTGRFKVFSHLSEWFEEFRLYHRQDNKIVKLRDDLMSATRQCVMMLRLAEVEPQYRRVVQPLRRVL